MTTLGFLNKVTNQDQPLFFWRWPLRPLLDLPPGMLRSSKPAEILETFGLKDEDEHAADNELNVFFAFSQKCTPRKGRCALFHQRR